MEIIKIKDQVNSDFIYKILNRGESVNKDIEKTVNDIITDVRENGDKALFDYTLKFDKASINKENVQVSKEEIEKAYNLIDKNLLKVIKEAIERVKYFHLKQKQSSWFDTPSDGEFLGQMIVAIEKAGVYVPGGKAAYPSTVIMNVIPAVIAGVKNIVMTTPCNEKGEVNPVTLVVANETNVTQIFKIGGAQAIAALAFGTESVPKVDKIVGPGNIFVALAKKAVYGFCSIDSIAGPSEILVIADSSANPTHIAADLLSQAEHDEMASSILVTTDEDFAKEVVKKVYEQTETLSRKEIIKKSLKDFGAVFVCDDLKKAVEISNCIAPEHLEICIDEPFSLLPLVKNAGAIFLGHNTPEPLGDYLAGSNHVLPTGGTAKFFSALGVSDFTKKISVLNFSKEKLMELSDSIITFAEAEGLSAHANSIKVRKDGN